LSRKLGEIVTTSNNNEMKIEVFDHPRDTKVTVNGQTVPNLYRVEIIMDTSEDKLTEIKLFAVGLNFK